MTTNSKTTTPKKKSFSFKSLIFKEDESEVSDNKELIQNTQVPQQTYVPTTQNIGTGVGIVVPEIKADLEKVLNDHNFPGEDYLELREAIAGMTKVGIDNATAIKGAFATLTTRGLSKEKAISTANQYIDILNTEKENFNQAFQKQTELKVQKPNSEINDLNLKNQDIAKQIENLTKQISSNNELINTKKTEITQAQISIETTKLNYEATHSFCVKEIQEDIAKINTLIQ